MEPIGTETLTQDELVAKLQKRGYRDVTARRVADWRVNDLLPSFDLIGGGRGKHRGWESSSWSNGEAILNQAIWVCELLKLDRSFENLYLPLWILGYPVPLARIRAALSKPLNATARAIESEAGTSGEIEDIIGDAAYEITQMMKRIKAEMLQLPQETLEAGVNIFFNEGYDLTDAPFQDAVEELREWNQTIQQMRAAARGGEGTGDDDAIPSQQPDSLETIFVHAPFFKEYLSLPRLKQAVDECTDDDLRMVERDLQIMREVALLFRRMIVILMRDMPAEFKAPPAQILPSIFRAGKLLVWADLSLRRNGFAEVIDYCLSELLNKCREEINEKLELEMAAASPHIAAAMKTCFEQLTGSPS